MGISRNVPNYFFGIILAMLINKKGVKFKSFYRTLLYSPLQYRSSFHCW